MNRTLTHEQTNKLFAFLNKQEIYDYDLQIEIIDHLASSIEDQWSKNSELGFGWALKNATSKFGKNGFRKMERKISRQLKHKFNRLLWNYFLDFLKLPKVIITITLGFGIFILLQLVNNKVGAIFGYCIPIAITSLYFHYHIFPKEINIEPVEGKTFMILKYLQSVNKQIGIISQLPFQFLIFFSLNPSAFLNSWQGQLIVATTLSLLTVFLYGYFFFLPQKIREHFFTNYAEFAQ